MKNPFTTQILPWLLHHANRLYHSPEFYKIKNELLSKYGKNVGYDVQFIEGKECHSCDGTGIYVGYRWSAITWGKLVTYQERCNRCSDGWYKRPTWNILSRIQFGKYVFHHPFQRLYVKPNEDWGELIIGYIEHDRSKFSTLAGTILFLIYEKGYLKRYYKEHGHGKYVYWWYPQNWPNNIIYKIKHYRNELTELPF